MSIKQVVVSKKTPIQEIIAGYAIPAMLSTNTKNSNTEIQIKQNKAKIGAFHDNAMELLVKLSLRNTRLQPW